MCCWELRYVFILCFIFFIWKDVIRIMNHLNGIYGIILLEWRTLLDTADMTFHKNWIISLIIFYEYIISHNKEEKFYVHNFLQQILRSDMLLLLLFFFFLRQRSDLLLVLIFSFFFLFYLLLKVFNLRFGIYQKENTLIDNEVIVCFTQEKKN